jgi:hypothetical protein
MSYSPLKNSLNNEDKPKFPKSDEHSSNSPLLSVQNDLPDNETIEEDVPREEWIFINEQSPEAKKNASSSPKKLVRKIVFLPIPVLFFF